MLPGFRVGFVSRYPPVHCGVGEYTRMLAGALRSIDPSVEVTVYSTFEAGRDPYMDEVHGVRVVPSYERGASDYGGLLDALAEDGGVDVLHLQHEYGIYGFNNGVLEALLEARRERLARAAVVTMHTVYHPLSQRREALDFQSRLDLLDAIIAHSVLQEHELQVQGLHPSRIYRVPHGTLINEYLGHPRHALLRELGIREEDIKGMLLAVPGFLRLDKGLDVLAEALSMLPEGWATVVVAGETWSPDAEKGLEAVPGLLRINRYLSHDEILKLVAVADAIVLPYRDKPGAYAVSGILHLSMGGLKPIIGTRVPRLVELYQHAPALTVPPRDPEALAGILAWLRDNYDLAAAHMTEVYAYAARTQWPRVARKHLYLYNSILRGEKPPSLGELAAY